MSYFLSGFVEILTGHYPLFMFAGVALGMVLGCLPGLTGSLGIALMLPFTYHMDALTALVFLLSIYTGGLFGGAVTAIMINTPGSAANMVTMLDGYPMARRGDGGRAMGIALLASVMGGLIGCVFLVAATEPLATFALKFGPGEMFMVVFFGLSCIGSLAKNPLKSIYSGLFGILLGTIGMSSVGAIRGTYGLVYLMDGIPMTSALIGFLALPEIILLINQTSMVKDLSSKNIGPRSIIDGFRDVILRPIQTILCSILGVVVGVIPAAGASVAGVLSYNQARQWTKAGNQFGNGVPEGIVACETANNASEGGALATLFVLGIPGSSSTAMLLGALVLQGWSPGPKLFIDNKEIIYTAFSSLFLQQIVMLIVGFILCSCAVYLVKVPTRYLVPLILTFTLVGAYSNRYAVFDVGLMVLFGVIGLLMKKADFPIMPLILGLLLGGNADAELLRIFQAYDNFFEIFGSPIVVLLTAVSAFCIVAPLVSKKIKRKI